MVYVSRFLLVMLLCLFGTAQIVSAEETTTGGSAAETATTATESPKLGRFEQLVEMFRAKIAGLKSMNAVNDDGKKEKGSKGAWERGVSMKNADSTCMQAAIDVREVAVQNAFSKYSAAVVDALKVRQKALFDAWGLSEVEARMTALKDTWKAWKDGQKTASKTLKSERDAAWKTFRTTAKTSCSATIPAEEVMGVDTVGTTAL